MSKTAFDQIMEGLLEAVEIVEGRADPSTYRVHTPPEIDVKAVRKRTGLSQARFAARFGFSRGAVTDWEQGRRKPEAAARTLLKVIEREPEAVDRALAAR